jgi:hypothetical protein
LPEDVGDFGVGDIAMSAAETAAVTDDGRTFEVIDLAWLKIVRLGDGFDWEILEPEPGALDAEAAGGAV